MTGDVGAKDGCGGGARARFEAGCFTHDRTLARQRVWAYTIASPAADGRWQHDKTVWPCQQRRMHWREERARDMEVFRLQKAGWLLAGSSLPQLLQEGFAQTPAVKCCLKGQQLYLFIMRGYTFVILFIRLVCEPLGCILLVFSFLCNCKGWNITLFLLLLMKIEITL